MYEVCMYNVINLLIFPNLPLTSGTGHFSPLAGYDEEEDMVLILDTARFKYPPHWIKLELLLEAMKEQDPDSGMLKNLKVS